MIRPLISIGALAATFAATPTFAADAVYANARYGYSIHYPGELFIAGDEPDSGDGVVVKARGGDAEFRVWANYAPMNETPAQFAAEAEKDCAKRPAAYRVVKPTLVAVSCTTADGHILYEKMLIHKGLGVTLQMTYPAAERARWDKVTSQIAGSLKLAR